MTIATSVIASTLMIPGWAEGENAPLAPVAGEALPCHRVDPEIFFSEQPVVLEQAKSHCAPCPVRSACLAGALSRNEPWGVWGGEIFERGRVIATKRLGGRPRTSAA